MKISQKKYKFAVIATDVVVFTVKDKALQVLLIKMQKPPYEKCWAMPGGLVDPEESVNCSAQRVLREKTGLKDVYLEQLYTFGEVERDPFGRVVSVAYFALIPFTDALKTSQEYGGVEWFSTKNSPTLAYDHKKILAKAVQRLRAKLGYTDIARNLLPQYFTLTELQSIYETILERKIDKRNFRKKILALGIVKKTEKKRDGLPNRPAALFVFSQKNQRIVDIL